VYRPPSSDGARRTETVSVVPLLDQLVKNSRSTLLVLLGAVSCLLLIACVNVANLLLARAVARQREICLRLSLGATHVRLFVQLMIESIAISLLGCFFGLLLTYAGTVSEEAIELSALASWASIHPLRIY
jgi:putative ABC transport system permease protein